MNLADILKEDVPRDEEGMAKDLKEAGMPASGLERIGGILASMASKLLEILVPLYGSDSEQGKRLLRAIRTLQPLTKGVRTEDIMAVLQVLENVVSPKGNLPPDVLAQVQGLAMSSPTVSPATATAPPATGTAPTVTPEEGTKALAGLEALLK